MQNQIDISTIKRNFQIVLADEPPVFDPVNPALIKEFNDCENLPSLLPEEHVRRKAVKTGGRGLGKIIDISRAGQEAISACQLVGLQDIAAKLVPMTKSIFRASSVTSLFACFLDGVDAEFSDNYIVLEPAYYLSTKTNRDKSHLLSQIEDIKGICRAIPDEHIRKYDLCDVVNDIHFAKVVNFSVYALALVHGWLHCNHSLDVETLKQSLVELGYGIDTTH